MNGERRIGRIDFDYFSEVSFNHPRVSSRSLAEEERLGDVVLRMVEAPIDKLWMRRRNVLDKAAITG